MKGANKVLAICQSASEQELLFRASTPARRIHSRIDASGYRGRLMGLSVELGDLGRQAIGVINVLERATQAFDTPFLIDCVREELNGYSASALYSPTARVLAAGPFTGLILHEDERMRLTLMSLSPVGHKLKRHRVSVSGGQGVTIPGSDSVVRFLKADGAVLRIWEVEPFMGDQALGQRVLPDCRRQTVKSGDVVRLVGARHGMSVEHTRGPIVFIMATCLMSRSSVNAHYDESSGSLHSFTAADMASSRVQLLATMLREVGQAGFESLVSQLNHGDHFVRWHVMREMIAMDAERATPFLLNIAREDPHPQVRDAAGKVSDMMSEGALCRA